MKYIKAIHPMDAYYGDRNELIGKPVRLLKLDNVKRIEEYKGWSRGSFYIGENENHFFAMKFTSVKPKKKAGKK